MQNYSLAVSGDIFRWIVDYAPADMVSKVSLFDPESKDNANGFQDAREGQSFCENVAR
jgi:hypothetical protein